MSATVAAERIPEPREPRRDPARGTPVLDTMRGALRILGGMVQMGRVGITRLFAVAALKAAEAGADAVEAAESHEDESEPKPHRSHAGGS